MTKNLFVIRGTKGKILYRIEGDGYFFYSVTSMKFYFIDKVTGSLLLQRLNVKDRAEVKEKIEKILGYSITGIYTEVKKHYLELIPKELLSI